MSPILQQTKIQWFQWLIFVFFSCCKPVSPSATRPGNQFEVGYDWWSLDDGEGKIICQIDQNSQRTSSRDWTFSNRNPSNTRPCTRVYEQYNLDKTDSAKRKLQTNKPKSLKWIAHSKSISHRWRQTLELQISPWRRITWEELKLDTPRGIS